MEGHPQLPTQCLRCDCVGGTGFEGPSGETEEALGAVRLRGGRGAKSRGNQGARRRVWTAHGFASE